MDELEGFLMKDRELLMEDIWATDVSDGYDHMNLDMLTEWWAAPEFPDLGAFQSDILPFMEEEQFAVLNEMHASFQHEEQENSVLCFMNDEQGNDVFPQQDIQEQEKYLVSQTQMPLDEEVQEEEEGVESDDKKADENNSKNLVSERNRRKRLNHQLFTLRSLVPNITKMDKRSILVDALAYLQGITEQIEKEMEKINLSSDFSGASSSSPSSSSYVEDEVQPAPVQTTIYEQQCAALPALSEMDAEALDEERFTLRIICNKAVGALGQVHRAIEMLGLEITCISMNEFDQESMQTTTFLRVKKKGVVTQEKLMHRMRLNVKQLGLLVPHDN